MLNPLLSSWGDAIDPQRMLIGLAVGVVLLVVLVTMSKVHPFLSIFF